jgi:hypothetical protein
VCYNIFIFNRSGKTAEKELYAPVKEYLTEIFTEKFGNCYLEITADGVFSDLLKKVIRNDIIFTFLRKKISPDLTGFIHSRGSELVLTYGPSVVKDFITVEIKRKKIAPQDIYQAKMYGDLFQAKYALLISSVLIPEEIRRLDKQIFLTHRFMSGWAVHVGEWCVDEGAVIISNWIPRPPF